MANVITVMSSISIIKVSKKLSLTMSRCMDFIDVEAKLSRQTRGEFEERHNTFLMIY